MNDRELEVKRLLAERPKDKDLMKDSPPNSKKTYIELAVEIGDVDALNVVIDGLNNTPLHLAIFKGQRELALAIIKAGADVNIQNAFGYAPLHFAARSKENAIDVVEALLGASADCTKKGKDGKNPIQIAVEARNFNILDALLKAGAPINTRQKFIIRNFKAYLELKNGDKELFSAGGYCNGFAFLAHYFDSHGKSEVWKKIQEILVIADVTEEGLNKKLVAPLEEYETVGKLLEEFLGQLTFFFDPTKFTNVRQQNRQGQLALIGESAGFRQIFRYLDSYSLNKPQLIEILEILRHFPGNARFEITGAEHATGFKINDKHQFEYWDSEFESPSPVIAADAKSFAELVIKTKYADLGHKVGADDQGNDLIDSFLLQGYYFLWENSHLSSFNYFRDNELPKSREEADSFIENSPCGFSHFDIAVITNSKDNFGKLLNNDFCVDYLNKPSIAFEEKTPIERLFASRNVAMTSIFFSKINTLSIDKDAIQNQLLASLKYAAAIMVISGKTEDAEFVKQMIGYLSSSCLKDFLITMAYVNKDPAMVDRILNHKNFDTTDSADLLSILEDKNVNASIKSVIQKHMSSQKNAAEVKVPLWAIREIEPEKKQRTVTEGSDSGEIDKPVSEEEKSQKLR
jgi:hypothetical protein